MKTKKFNIDTCFSELDNLDKVVDIDSKKNLYAEIQNSQNEIFEPSITCFKNAIVVNYKKVGTRFFDTIASYPHNVDEFKLQLDLRYLKNIDDYSLETSLLHGGNITDPFKFHGNQNNNPWKNIETFFNYHGVSSWDEFLFKNPKEFIFVIRNPVKRFLSGVSQIVASFVNESLGIETERADLIKNSNLTNEEIDIFVKTFDSEKHLNDEQLKLHSKVTEYILRYRWDLILQDVHTQNYLSSFIDWIDRIEDKSKIKIINLDDCKSLKSLKLYNQIRGDELLNEFWNNKDSFIDSNKKIYSRVVNSLVEKETNFWVKFLKDELYMYIQLLNYDYYYDIKDPVI